MLAIAIQSTLAAFNYHCAVDITRIIEDSSLIGYYGTRLGLSGDQSYIIGIVVYSLDIAGNSKNAYDCR